MKFPLARTLPTTSSVWPGVAVPMPTLTALAPVPPSTRALLSLTTAFAPIAVALTSAVELLSGPAL